MTSPRTGAEAIPADVMRIATKAVLDSSISVPRNVAAITMVALAIMSERERCAVTAENSTFESWIDGVEVPVEYREEIAATIRAPIRECQP